MADYKTGRMGSRACRSRSDGIDLCPQSKSGVSDGSEAHLMSWLRKHALELGQQGKCPSGGKTPDTAQEGAVG